MRGGGALSTHRREAASTGPAFERLLPVSGGRAAGPGPGGPSSPACGAHRPAAGKGRQEVKGRSQAGSLYCCVATDLKPTDSTPALQATPPYRLLLAEQEAAQLWIGARVRDAEDGSLGRSLATLCDLVGRSSAPWRLLIGRHGRSHGHLGDVGKKSVEHSADCRPVCWCVLTGPRRPPGGHTGHFQSCTLAKGFSAPCNRKEDMLQAVRWV